MSSVIGFRCVVGYRHDQWSLHPDGCSGRQPGWSRLLPRSTSSAHIGCNAGWVHYPGPTELAVSGEGRELDDMRRDLKRRPDGVANSTVSEHLAPLSALRASHKPRYLHQTGWLNNSNTECYQMADCTHRIELIEF
jgi:hypothetical protein